MGESWLGIFGGQVETGPVGERVVSSWADADRVSDNGVVPVSVTAETDGADELGETVALSTRYYAELRRKAKAWDRYIREGDGMCSACVPRCTDGTACI
jgi:hypothetical protein